MKIRVRLQVIDFASYGSNFQGSSGKLTFLGRASGLSLAKITIYSLRIKAVTVRFGANFCAILLNVDQVVHTQVVGRDVERSQPYYRTRLK